MKFPMPNWSDVYTAAQAERELSNFKFKGPGWYIRKIPATLTAPAEIDIVLVIAIDRPVETAWHQAFTADERFEFNVYNDRCPFDDFSAIVNAPTREDER